MSNCKEQAHSKHNIPRLYSRRDCFQCILIGYAIKFTPNCCNGFLWLVSAKRYFFSCIGQLWSQCISNDRLQKSIRLFTIKSFCRHKPCESHRNSKIFEKCSLNHGKRWQVAKYHNRKRDTTNHVICVKVMGNGSLKSLMEYSTFSTDQILV